MKFKPHKSVIIGATTVFILFFLSLVWHSVKQNVIMIHTDDSGVGYTFFVELARTEEEKRLGLMYRDHLETNRGMLFLYEQDFIPHFWMKNVVIDLDMLFLSADGTIEHIETAVPCQAEEDECKLYSPPQPVRHVLEILGGEAEKLGIQPGDKVEGISHFMR